jgi:hypothetical protein
MVGYFASVCSSRNMGGGEIFIISRFLQYFTGDPGPNHRIESYSPDRKSYNPGRAAGRNDSEDRRRKGMG